MQMMSAKLRASSPKVFLDFIPVTCSEDPGESSRETRCRNESSFSDGRTSGGDSHNPSKAPDMPSLRSSASSTR